MIKLTDKDKKTLQTFVLVMAYALAHASAQYFFKG